MAYSPNNINGQATMANSAPVVIASNQTAIPVAVTTTDIAPATQNVTVVDSSSTSAGGANNQTIIIGTPTAGSAASFTLSGIETVRVEVTGIWTGTIASEASIDGGTTWTTQGLHQGAYTTGSFTAGFIGGANVAGCTNYRIRATAAITGTVVVKVIESVNTQSVYIANAAPSGTVISVLNSTTATLTSGSIYTGTGEDVTNFSEMRVSIFSDVASATDGLSLQQSSNNTNWDITDTYTIPAATGKTFVIPRQARYFRVVYTNGGTNQATMRLQSILNRTATAPSSQRANDAYTNETDLVQNQVFPMGFNGATWDRIRSVNTGSLKTDMSSVAGTATDVNSGTKSAGTIRVVLATDQPQLTNKLLVTPDSVALPANQSVNVSQINAVTPLMGNGATGTGSQRVTVANDNTGIANWGHGATAATAPAGATYEGGLGKTANPTAVTDGQLVGALRDKLGKAVVVGAIRDLKGNQITTITTSTAETTVITQVASTFLDVYGCICVNSSAAATNVSFKDSTAGTTRFNVYIPAGETRGFMLPAGDGFAQTTVNNNWTATSSASITSLIVTMLYVKNT